MRRMVLPLATIALVAWFASEATAQTTKTVRGTVTAMTGDLVTVKAGSQEMKFTVDAKTRVTAEGGSTATKQAETAGKPGPKLAELIQVGNAVEVTYAEAGGAMRATGIRRVRDAGAAGGASADQSTETVTGTVDSISGNTVALTGSSTAGATFKLSVTVDNSTKMIAEGAGTAAAMSGGKLVLSDHLGPGDRITVTYHTKGTTLHASEIRVRQKAKK